MTGPEHYAEAERLVEAATEDLHAGHHEGNRVEHDSQVARALVHATLALAAATAEPVAVQYDGIDAPGTQDIQKAWAEAIS